MCTDCKSLILSKLRQRINVGYYFVISVTIAMNKSIDMGRKNVMGEFMERT